MYIVLVSFVERQFRAGWIFGNSRHVRVWWLANWLEYMVYAQGADLLWCFSVVAIPTKRWTECKQHRVGPGILSILPLLPSQQNYVRVFRSGRPLMPTLILQAGFQDVICDTIRTLGHRDFPATNNSLKSVHR
jgi:hypothetical protein